jgi:hypothetical protein
MSIEYIKEVAIVGAGGQQGKWIVQELLKTGKHNVTALTRADSATAVPEGVKSAIIDYGNQSTMVDALKGKDCLIITMSVMAPQDSQTKLLRAAAEANVPWVLPNEWGNDYADDSRGKEMFVGLGIVNARNLIVELGKSNYVAICCGFWYEYSLGVSRLCYGFDHRNKTVTFYDEGNTKIDTSTWSLVGKAVASLLSLPVESNSGPSVSDWKNKPLRVCSFSVSQKDMYESVKRVTGTSDKDWTITYEPVQQRYQDGLKEFDGGKGSRRGFAKLLYARGFFTDGAADFVTRNGRDNDKLGLPEEDLDAATKIGVERGLTMDIFGDHA